jgi:hypothetical protein
VKMLGLKQQRKPKNGSVTMRDVMSIVNIILGVYFRNKHGYDHVNAPQI